MRQSESKLLLARKKGYRSYQEYIRGKYKVGSVAEYQRIKKSQKNYLFS